MSSGNGFTVTGGYGNGGVWLYCNGEKVRRKCTMRGDYTVKGT